MMVSVPLVHLQSESVEQSLNSSLWEATVQDMREIGSALETYKETNGKFPDSLSRLVQDGLLETETLVCPFDPYKGKQGSLPDSYDVQRIIQNAEEIGCSYFYEFSGKPFVIGWVKPDKTAKLSTWYEVKKKQFAEGKVRGARGETASVSAESFPVVRCFWVGYPNYAKRKTAAGIPMTVLNLAMDLKTVFASNDIWELSLLRRAASDEEALLRELPNPVLFKHSEKLILPMWLELFDVNRVSLSLVKHPDFIKLDGTMLILEEVPDSVRSFAIGINAKTENLQGIEFTLEFSAE